MAQPAGRLSMRRASPSTFRVYSGLWSPLRHRKKSSCIARAGRSGRWPLLGQVNRRRTYPALPRNLGRFTPLVPGVCVDIRLGTPFQHRCTGDTALIFTCTPMLPWPGDDEAVIVDGPWAPRVNPAP